MRTFHYLAPGPEEQRAFIIQLAGTVAGAVVIGVLAWRTHDVSLRGMLWGTGIALVWMLARTAWDLEKKARRAAAASLGVAEEGLHITDADAKTQVVAWDAIEQCDVIGGRLVVTWAQGKLAIGAREMEDGMDMVRAVLKMREGDAAPQGFVAPTNFIPLDPR